MTQPISRILAASMSLALVAAACSTAPATPPAPEPPAAPDPSTAPEPSAAPEPSGTPGPAPEDPPEAITGSGVSAAHPLAVDAGMRILESGGTAADAAIATAFAVAVVEPFASGIGGGGAALVAEIDGAATAYDYREVVANSGEIPASGTGIPGFVAGMDRLHQDHGALPWPDLLAPAIELADDGFPVSDFLAARLGSDRGPEATASLEHFAPGGRALGPREMLVQSDLASVMRTLAEEGAGAFYTGELADRLAGIDGIDTDSLASYQVQVAAPSSGPFGDFEVLSAAPALPGPAVIQMLQIAESAGAGEQNPDTGEYVTTLSGAWEVARHTATTMLGDPAFSDVPVEELTDPAANSGLATQLSHTPAGPPSEETEHLAAMEARATTSSNTTHLTVVDSTGRTVSMSNTITAFWGSGESFSGFFLNDQLTRFQAIASPANTPGPGRRSVSWAAPVILRDEAGRPVLGIGSPGGERIPSILTNVLVRWALHGQDLHDAVAAPRFIQEDGAIVVEQWFPDEARSALTAAGVEVRTADPRLAYFGSVQGLEIDHLTGEVSGARDGRREAGHAINQP